MKKQTMAVTVLTATIQTALDNVITGTLTLGAARTEASTRNQALATALDRVCRDWTLVKGNAKYDEDKLNGMKPDMFTKITGMRSEITTQMEAAGIEDTKQPMRDIARRSIGFTGSKPLHPTVKAAADKMEAAKPKKEVEKKETSPIGVARQQVNNSISALHLLIDAQGVAGVPIADSELALECLTEAAKYLANIEAE